MSFCPNCGSELSSNAKFCVNCGAKVLNDQPTYNQSETQSNNQPTTQTFSNAIIGLVNTAKSSIENAVNKNQTNSTAQPVPFTQNNQQTDEAPFKNCPNCGAPVSSFSARCQSCGIEISSKTQASACQELCNRLDQIEATRPKESIFSFVTGLANKALDNHNISPTDQQKIELISNFIVPNTKADILEFIFLAQTRIKSCHDLSIATTDDYVSHVQNEMKKVWEAKLEQTIEKAKIVLANDSEFSSVLKTYIIQKHKNEGVCQYCGGKFKGMFTKVCSNCGKPKDY